MDYIITEVLGVKDNVYEGKASVRFKVKGVEHQLSVLTNEKEKFVEGATITGTITPKEKDGKTFYNFNTSTKKSTPAPDYNRVEIKCDAILTEQQMIRGILTDMRGVLADILQQHAPDFSKKPSEQPYDERI